MPSTPKKPKFMEAKKRRELLKQMYMSKRHYRSRGLWARTNKGLYMVLKKYGHEAWVQAINNM